MRTHKILLALIVAAVVPRIGTAGNKPDQLGEVKFRFDSAVLPADVRAQLDSAATFAATHPSTRLVLDAHCDPIGTSPYNVGLAIRRADSVRDALIEMGVPDEQIVFAIYGKDGAHRARYADDRRVSLWSTREPLSAVVAMTLAGRGTAVTWGKPLTTAEIETAPEPVASR